MKLVVFIMPLLAVGAGREVDPARLSGFQPLPTVMDSEKYPINDAKIQLGRNPQVRTPHRLIETVNGRAGSHACLLLIPERRPRSQSAALSQPESHPPDV
jgi:hypothetical protein